MIREKVMRYTVNTLRNGHVVAFTGGEVPIAVDAA